MHPSDRNPRALTEDEKTIGTEGWLTESALLPQPAVPIEGLSGSHVLRELESVIVKRAVKIGRSEQSSKFKSIEDAIVRQKRKGEQRRQNDLSLKKQRQEDKDERESERQRKVHTLSQKAKLYSKLSAEGADADRAYDEVQKLSNEINKTRITENNIKLKKYKIECGDSLLVNFDEKGSRSKSALELLEEQLESPSVPPPPPPPTRITRSEFQSSSSAEVQPPVENLVTEIDKTDKIRNLIRLRMKKAQDKKEEQKKEENEET